MKNFCFTLSKLSRQRYANKHPNNLPTVTKKFNNTKDFPLHFKGIISPMREEGNGILKP